jgi:hypothetical protein
MEDLVFRAKGSPEQVLDLVEHACSRAGLPVATRGPTSIGAKRESLFGSDTFLAAVGDEAGTFVLMCRHEGKRGKAVAADLASSYPLFETQAFAVKQGQPIEKWPDSSVHEANVSALVFDAPEDEVYLDVVGESNYQAALLEAADGRTTVGPAVSERTAFLMPEPNNPHDSNAVRVFMIPGGLVGYLSKGDAVDYRDVIDRVALIGQVVACEAEITGGWDRGPDDMGSFGVRLRLAEPDSLLEELEEST